MTKRDNAAIAGSKIDIAPLHTLTPAMVASIARSHGVSVETLMARLALRVGETS